jgi:hypothetical protein
MRLNILGNISSISYQVNVGGDKALNNTTYGGGRAFGALFRFREWFRKLFKKELAEPLIESGAESRWESDYKDIFKCNLTEIFANRLTNYTLSESSVVCDDEAIGEALGRAVCKWYKWTQMAYGIGRVYLIPYAVESIIYTDIVPQSRAWITKKLGDDVHGIGVLSDVRWKDKDMFVRLTSYEWDIKTKQFTIENKATRRSGSPVPLDVIEEWASIEPLIVMQGVETPLFAYVDCPKDNRTTDAVQGAPITYGCQGTIDEIIQTFEQFNDEFDLKQTWLGVDRAMLDKNGQPDKSKLYKTFIGKSTESLFEIFSPDIRDSSFKERILELFGRLEKQVGTSAGILTPADTANATATQVRRSMFDTLAIVDRMRDSVERALRSLCEIYSYYLSLIGEGHSDDYSIKITWGKSMIDDRMELFNELMQAHNAGAVKTEEVRAFIRPEESEEERKKSIEEIRESKPEETIPDFFGS